jgi:hypothetical protein
MSRNVKDHLLIGGSVLLTCAFAAVSTAQPQQDVVTHPILIAIKEKWLVVPKSKEEFPTRVTVLGTTCNALVLLYATIQDTNRPPYFMLEYSKSTDIMGKNNPDACLELEVPEIDTKFDLTFAPSGKRNEIMFTGQMQPNCKDCKPKKGKSISGVLRSNSDKKYRLSFTGDLADEFDLEPMHE